VYHPRRGLTLVALLTLWLLAGPPILAGPTTDIVYLRMPVSAYEAAGPERVPATRTLDYGTFVWLELAAADLAAPETAGLPHQLHASSFSLQLGGLSFDPLQDQVKLADGWAGVRSKGPDLHLVQLVGPTRDEWLDRLQGDGLELVQYIHPLTYVVWGDAWTAGRSKSIYCCIVAPTLPRQAANSRLWEAGAMAVLR
jgi:hypothetical protein